MQSFKMDQLPLVATVLCITILGTNAWSYKDAKKWGEKYPKCNGTNQSPIFFNAPGEMGYFPEFKKNLRLTDFDKVPKKLTIRNTGHTVEMKAKWSGEPPKLAGGPLHGDYVFEKVTLHWRPKEWSNEARPNATSKITLLQDMEMHMFFYKADLKSFEKASAKKGGLAVISHWLWSGFGDPEDTFDILEKNIHKVQNPNSTVEIPTFNFVNSFEDKYEPYNFYEGSLDYPPCTESVTWFIVDATLSIKKGFIREVRKIKLAAGDVSNVRPNQELNERKVRAVYNRYHDGY